MTSQRFVIVGAGLAAVKAAQTLREEGFSGEVVMVGAEAHPPYERPPLSKDYLQGKAQRDSVFVQPASWFQEQSITLRQGTSVQGLQLGERQVQLSDGTLLAYDALLLATGSTPRRLNVPGADATGVHYLRTLDDADALRAGLDTTQHLVIVGGGWIGLEVAAVAREQGVAVTVLEQAELPLVGVLGPEVAQVFADLHRAHGVDLRCGVGVQSFIATDGAFAGVELADGTVLTADRAVVGVGVTPSIEFARSSGLDIGSGILVDATLRTSGPAVFAAGDIAEAEHPLLERRIRVEHWANALNQGPHAARSMLGGTQPYDRLPYFYTDQYDLGMEYTGYAGPGDYDQVVVRGDTSGLDFMAFWLSGGRVLAGMHVSRWDTIGSVGDLIRSGRRVDPARLADDAVGLAEV